ncbi:M20/M25/M40 family metallo-hydrolase [Roseibacillus ishigakijimensis]|uniref:M20/M25/M40 family metallo-hydrolase n=1 Tax=Roseibacillus ishigakijimensis TaxID=454146 RepID=A0A934RPL1_9BACT|nr:M20/M25/M40 family metallo-hydrolase [Roseibacillus ishigakijimensis]MBK1834623.1 M20/M25/M40 family metallo-hydrolase [Roseibacillus ishigakijimensis]
MTKTEQKFLFKLLETASPTGWEMPGQRVWADYIKDHADAVECDTYGSTWATIEGKSKKVLMLESHADEIGYIVKHVTKEGFLRIDRLGGSDAATARGRRIRIFGDKDEVHGIIGNTAIHLRRDSLANEKAPQVHQLWVDVGASSKEEVAQMGLRVGHPAVYLDGPMELGKDLIVSRAIDNRIGGYIHAQVLKAIKASGQKPAWTIVALNSVQEEIGGHGARMATNRLQPDAAICVDVTHATDTPNIDHTQHGEVTLGGGPTVTHGAANHPLLVERLLQVADKAKVPVQHEAAGRFTGTDTDSIYNVHSGVSSALVSLPLRCMHSVVETAHRRDIQQTIDLLTALALDLKSKDDFAQKL